MKKEMNYTLIIIHTKIIKYYHNTFISVRKTGFLHMIIFHRLYPYIIIKDISPTILIIA